MAKNIQAVEPSLRIQTIPDEKRVHARVEASLPIYLEVKNRSSDSPSNFIGQTTDISEGGLGVILKEKLIFPSDVSLRIGPTGSYPGMQAEAEVLWNEAAPFIKDHKGRYGLRFLELKNGSTLRELLDKVNINYLGEFFGVPIPEHINRDCKNNYVFKKFDQKQIMRVIDFAPPFLKIQKIVILNADGGSNLQTKGLAMGIVTTKDTAGHYNDTVFLAMCGALMASTASIHLAVLFPSTAPEVIEANGVRPEEKGIWKPSDRGTVFWVETTIIKKKLRLASVRTRISFDKVPYGVVDELKLFLVPKELIWQAKQLPSIL